VSERVCWLFAASDAIKFKCRRRRYAKGTQRQAAFDQSGADTRRVLCLVSYFAASTANGERVCVCSFEVCIRPPQTVELARYVLCARQKRDSEPPVYLCCLSFSLSLWLVRSLSQRLELQNFGARAAHSARSRPGCNFSCSLNT
jgi:hypothetical protein